MRIGVVPWRQRIKESTRLSLGSNNAVHGPNGSRGLEGMQPPRKLCEHFTESISQSPLRLFFHVWGIEGWEETWLFMVPLRFAQKVHPFSNEQKPQVQSTETNPLTHGEG